MAWTRTPLAERCGSCSKPIAAQAVVWTWSVPGGPRLVRCRPCGEDLLGVCELFDPPEAEVVDGVAPQPGLFAPEAANGWTTSGQLVVTAGQLLARNQARAAAIARAQERRRR